MLDTSVYKRLAHNDTGAAAGHQAGIVIPKAIAQFFPPLPAVVATGGPTVDTSLTADLFVDGRRVATVTTRYQHQTWGGTRRAERRLTDNLGALRNEATEDDILLFTKDLADDGYIQLHLVRKGTPEFKHLDANLGPKRWGPVDPDNPPVTTGEIADAEEYVDEQKAEAFTENRAETESSTKRKARDRAFRKKVLDAYGHACAFTARRFVSPLSSMVVGLDAAHIVPVASNGSDYPGNGLALTKELHWSFDRGLIGVSGDRKIFVPSSVRALPGNEFLRDLHGQPIREGVPRALDDALEWHRYNRLVP